MKKDEGHMRGLQLGVLLLLEKQGTCKLSPQAFLARAPLLQHGFLTFPRLFSLHHPACTEKCSLVIW